MSPKRVTEPDKLLRRELLRSPFVKSERNVRFNRIICRIRRVEFSGELKLEVRGTRICTN